MSKADDVFGPLAGPLVAEWGSDCQYIRVSDPGTYDPSPARSPEASRRSTSRR